MSELKLNSEVKPPDSPLTDDMIDPIEGLKQLEKLISEAKEYDSKQKVSFNGNRMLNDLLDKPIGAENGEEEEEGIQKEEEDEEKVNFGIEEEMHDEDEDIEDETELIDEALDEVADEDKKRGLKRMIDDEEAEDGDDEEIDDELEDDDEETKTTQMSPKVSKTQMNRKTITSSKKKKKKSSNPTQRKNIKSILNESELDKETQRARKEEEERIARQMERSQQRWQELQAKQMQSLFGSPLNSMPNNINALNALNQRFGEIPDEVLLSSDDDDDKNKSFVDSLFRQKPSFNRTEEVIDLSSSDEESSNNKRTNFANSAINLDYNMRGAYDDDDVAIIGGSESAANFEDLNNCGSHTDDALNTPDAEGRVLLNVAHPPEDPDIYLAPQIAQKVKPHQIGGIRFLYDNVVESLERFKKTSGFGCILSHSMGLGKTMQVISFIDIFLTHTDAKHVLCIVPINTLQNWIHEFNMWTPEEGQTIDKYFKKSEINEDVKFRTFKVFAINDAKSMTARAKQILSWRKFGGVLLLGYEMYRILTSVNKNKSKKDEDLDPNVLDRINTEVKAALIDPGPDLVVCDEGHRIKNCNAATSQALKNIKTKRRIVLTGYPLQNKLMEYWCMVDFVRPNYLGQKSEFTNMFERPITNGQCTDSDENDKKLMRYRAHVLYHMLKGFVQRRSHSVLKKALPDKCEYVVMCRMSKIQKQLMMAFLDTAIKDPDAIGTIKGRISTLTLFAVCCKVWNHPDIVYDIVRQGIVTDDLDIDFPAKNNRSQAKNNRRRRVANGTTSNADPNDESMTINALNDIPSNLFDTPLRNQRNDGVLDFSWAEDILSEYTPGLIENSFKMVLLFEIIAECLAIGDRLLIFSQSLLTLDLIERFLQSRDVPKTRTKWCKNQTYYRLDGSTSSHERERYINLFNNTDSAHLFLISTRAGSLGINLIGANRIVIFDASWNPCHDAQAACRIYRYGQPKPCFIYRLVCDNSLEKKIYDRQVNKQGMANRVVDEQNVEANFTWKEIHSLLDDLHQIVEPPVEVYGDDKLSKFSDELIKKICIKLNNCITRLPFEHESLLLDRKEAKLSLAERKIALDHYKEAKRMGPGHRGLNIDYAHAMAAMRSHMSSRNLTYPYQMPYQMSSPLPSQMTPNPHYSPNNMSQYPDVSQPLPPYPPPPRGHSSTQFINFESIAETLVRNGNTVKKVRMPNDLSINVGPNTSVTIKRGEEVMVIQTQKGLYLRTSDGNIISIKNNNPFGSQPFNSFTPISKLNKDSFGIIQPNLQCGGTVCVTPSHSRASSTVSHPPEVVQLSDDDDEGAEEVCNETVDVLSTTNNTLDKTTNISTAEQSIMTNGSIEDLAVPDQNQSIAMSSSYESTSEPFLESTASTTGSQLNDTSNSLEALEL